jgi:hypothetical protein
MRRYLTGRFIYITFFGHPFLDINGLLMINFTPEDLVLYLYNETSPEKSLEITTAMEKDWTLREKFEVLKASIARLDKIIESPRTEVVLNVLRYARETNPETA